MELAASVAEGLAAHRENSRIRLAACMVVAMAAAVGAAAIAAAGPADNGAGIAFARAAIVGVPIAVGLYTWVTRPNERFGLLLAATGAGLFVTTLAETSDSLLYSVGRTTGWFVELLVVYLILSVPSGRLSTRADRVLFGGISAVVVAAFVPLILLEESLSVPSPFTSCTADCPGNAFLLPAQEPGFVDAFLRPTASVLLFLGMFAVMARLAWRIRAATPLARRIFTPVLGIGAVRVALAGIVFIGREFDPSAWSVEAAAWLVSLAMPAIALAFLAGLVSWRLFASDALQRLAECVNTSPNAPQLQGALATTLSDPTLRVAFPGSGDNGRWIDCWGAPVTFPAPGSGRSVTDVHHGRSVVAALVHDETLSSNRALLDAGAAMTAVALDNQRLTVEAESAAHRERLSSARIAASAARERRRIERDLHDGAQQRLVALGIELELATELVQKDRDRGVRRLRELRDQVDTALEEVRALAHGVYPPLLADGGVVEAVRAVALRAPVHTEVVAHDVGRLPTELESAVYFCVLEALQNALKHAEGARNVYVQFDRAGERLRFSVRDDGAGVPVGTMVDGRGITNMRDRVAALGGDVRITSNEAVGTTLRGWIPTSGPLPTDD
jgi:signal transduction histidine kinase